MVVLIIHVRCGPGLLIELERDAVVPGHFDSILALSVALQWVVIGAGKIHFTGFANFV